MSYTVYAVCTLYVHVCIHTHTHTIYRKYPTYETSSCELSNSGTRVPSASGSVTLQPGLRPPLLMLLRPTVSHLLSLLQSVTVLAQCQPLDASCWTVLLYFSRYYTIRFKICCLFFLYIIQVKSIIRLL